ncbi:3-isopropylmalate dehydratase small subunit [Herminiimonas sp. KBW02]|uniref:3-isopropylmalate dehydratase small subunit n=1 Tax=Herminiimonas sp. KBW02 TaxID=2153363 RepID=UPI000F5B7270|nr:3-isopropylmalate dehydratase small subunit [Herminiimonas sp. KBW02]RQO36028.1 3-isopropylmalate dehydratase small subunit [Herminiimonas sp. KBW02]
MSDATLLQGVAAPLLLANLDTDQIMPKQFLRIIDKAGLAPGVLYDLRFHPDGSPRPDFILNQPAFSGSKFLLGGANFGCGSSREHAVWGLQQLGIEAIIAPSFGEIFFGNALNNRLLLIALEEEKIAVLLADMDDGNHQLTINLDAMTISSAQHSFPFTLGARHRQMIVEGLDMIGATMQLLPEIERFEASHNARTPWSKVLPAA